MTPERIPLLIPDMPDADRLLPWLRRIDAARWYSNFGPLNREFEAALEAGFGGARSQAACTVANCTLGLELALTALGLPRGSRVLVPAFTFIATASAVLRAGLVPVLADIDAASWLLTPEFARRALASTKVSCVMPVATFGAPQDASAWDKFSAETGVPVLIDAAGAFGNQQGGELVKVVFSLHATKSLGAGEGGFVIARDHAWVSRFRQMTNFGISLPPDNAWTPGSATLPGSNAKLSEYHAAVGLAALQLWHERRVRRQQLSAAFLRMLADACPAVMPQQRPADGAYTIMAVALPDGADGDRVGASLAGSGIETRLWYYPLLVDQPAFSGIDAAMPLVNSRRLAGRVLGLPFHPGLSEGQLQRVSSALAAALRAS